MSPFKNIRLGIGLLFLASTPPYLVYDFHRLIDGEGTSSDRVFLAMTCCAVGALILWLFRQRGMDYARLKILWDWPAALVLLIISAPVLLITAVLIKLESAGPVIYKQERVGRNHRSRKERRRTPSADVHNESMNRRRGDRRRRDLGGRPFLIYKLRSMIVSAEEKTGAAWSTGDRDPRVTTVGYYIRRTHIDELPQLYNILLGQMSVIGPRPERPAFVAELSNVIESYNARLEVMPGITGLAQVRQRHDESLDDVRKKLSYDTEYIQNGRILLDMQIVVKTIALITNNLFFDSLGKEKTEQVEPKSIGGIVLETAHAERK